MGLWAVERLGLMELLSTLGINASLCTAAVASIMARLAYPAWERATHAWLRERSASGELLGEDFETMGAMQLYRASDALVAHREAIEAHLFDRAMDLFDLTPTVTIYDLTNTYYEGDVADQPEARRAFEGEAQRLQGAHVGAGAGRGWFCAAFPGVCGQHQEDRTLSGMLDALGAPPGSRVVLDRGIATERQLDWLKANGYRYIVVSRERKRPLRVRGGTRPPHPQRRGGAFREGGRCGGGRGALVLLFRGARREGARHGRAVGATPGAGSRCDQRGAVAAAHAEDAGKDLATHRSACGEELRCRPTL